VRQTKICRVMGWDLNLKSEWAGLLLIDLVFGSGGWLFWAISPHVLSTVDHWCCWALGPWWTTEVLDLIHGGPRKNGPLQLENNKSFGIYIRN
jgi:hypothetical protein